MDQNAPDTYAISIHALVKRATAPSDIGSFSFCISIHALVKRATQAELQDTSVTLDFNPRPREEGDWVKSAVSCLVGEFQSTPS